MKNKNESENQHFREKLFFFCRNLPKAKLQIY